MESPQNLLLFEFQNDISEINTKKQSILVQNAQTVHFPPRTCNFSIFIVYLSFYYVDTQSYMYIYISNVIVLLVMNNCTQSV